MAARIAASKLKGDIRFVGGRFSIGMGGSVGIGDRLGAVETMLSGAAAASLCAWWAVGFVIRAFETSKPVRGTQSEKDKQDVE